jgi:hypothetical protein
MAATKYSGKTSHPGNRVSVRFAHTDFDAESGASETLVVATTSEPCYFHGAYVDVDEAFSSGAGTTTGLNVVVGVSGNTDQYVGTTVLTSLEAGARAAAAGDTAAGQLVPAGTAIIATVTALGGTADLDELDGGDFTVHLQLTPVN